jgi:hypothetical protein
VLDLLHALLEAEGLVGRAVLVVALAAIVDAALAVDLLRRDRGGRGIVLRLLEADANVLLTRPVTALALHAGFGLEALLDLLRVDAIGGHVTLEALLALLWLVDLELGGHFLGLRSRERLIGLGVRSRQPMVIGVALVGPVVAVLAGLGPGVTVRLALVSCRCGWQEQEGQQEHPAARADQ